MAFLVGADTTCTLTKGVYVPVACTALTTTSSSIAGGQNNSVVVASTSGLSIGQGVVVGAALSAPAAPTGTGNTGAGSTLTAGTYPVAVSYVDQNGETTATVAASLITVGSGNNLVINSPAASQNATGWYAYVGTQGTPLTGALYRQQAPGSPTAIGTSLTLTANPSTSGVLMSTLTNTTANNPESATIQNIVGTTVTFGDGLGNVRALQNSHTGTINITGAPAAPCYWASANSIDLITRVGLYNGGGANVQFQLYKLLNGTSAGGMLATDVGASNLIYQHTWAANGYWTEPVNRALQAGSILAWAASGSGTPLNAITAEVDVYMGYSSAFVQPTLSAG